MTRLLGGLCFLAGALALGLQVWRVSSAEVLKTIPLQANGAKLVSEPFDLPAESSQWFLIVARDQLGEHNTPYRKPSFRITDAHGATVRQGDAPLRRTQNRMVEGIRTYVLGVFDSPITGLRFDAALDPQLVQDRQLRVWLEGRRIVPLNTRSWFWAGAVMLTVGGLVLGLTRRRPSERC